MQNKLTGAVVVVGIAIAAAYVLGVDLTAVVDLLKSIVTVIPGLG